MRVQGRDNADFTTERRRPHQCVHACPRRRPLPRGPRWTFRWLLRDSEAWDPVTSTPLDEAKLEVQELYADYQGDDLTVILPESPSHPAASGWSGWKNGSTSRGASTASRSAGTSAK